MPAYKSLLVGCSLALLAIQGKGAGFLDEWRQTNPIGLELSGIAYGGGLFVAAGPRGELLTSSDAVNWQQGTLPAAGIITDTAYGNDLFLAVGSVTNEGGLAMVSTDAVHWTTNIVITDRIESCAFGNGTFVAASYNSLFTSPDGLHWTPRYVGQAYFFGVDFLEDRFIALGPRGQTTTSPDGITWSPPSPADGVDLHASAYGDGTTVIVGDDERIKTTSGTRSADSTGWAGFSLLDVAYGNGHFVAVGWALDFGLGFIFTSTNGFDWLQPCFAEVPMLERVTFGNGLFVAVGSQGAVLTSPDGMDWTIRRGGVPATMYSAAAAKGVVVAVGGGYSAVGTVLIASPDDWSWHCPAWDSNVLARRVLYTNEQFLVVGSHGTISTSPDGLNWTNRASAIDDSLTDVTWAHGMYLAVSYGGQIERSGDGLTWTNQTIASGKLLTAVADGNDRFVVVGEQGISFSSHDGVTWTNGTSGTANWLGAVCFGNGAFVSVGDYGTILRSTDGLSWQSEVSPTTNGLAGVRFLANRFIALGNQGTILSSFDGIVWQLHLSGVPEVLRDVLLVGNRLLIIGDFGTALVSAHDVYPAIQPRGWSAGLGFELVISRNLGRPSYLQASSDFTTWQDLFTLGSSDTNQIYFDTTATNQPLRFYRLRTD